MHTDHLGSPAALTDASGGVIRRLRHGIFGELRASVAVPGAPASPGPAEAFNGKRHDAEFGLYHYGARDYDPSLGRFVQPDPIVPNPMNPQTLNRYAYVRNDPLNRIDPSGLVDVDFVGGSVRFTGGDYRYDSYGEGGFTGVDARYDYWPEGGGVAGQLEVRVYLYGRQPEFAAPQLYAVQNGRITDSLSSVGEAAQFLSWLDPEQRNLYVNGINKDAPEDLKLSL
ncbi:MAG: RHS repeat-associated core domain-containing protein, partial [Candidatus Rokuibacteriota bacterium]